MRFFGFAMKRKPHSLSKRELVEKTSREEIPFFDRLKFSKWLTTAQAAAYLGKFRRKDGEPSQGAIRNMIYREQIVAQKFFGRILISRSSLDQLIESSPQTGGI